MSIRKLFAGAALAVAALAGPAMAQQAPAFTGPYYLVDADEEFLLAVASGTRQRTRDIGQVTVVVLVPDSMVADLGGGARLDMRYEYRCGGSDHRVVAQAMYRESGELMLASEDVSEWETVTPESPNVSIRAFACDGTLPMDESVKDISVLFDFYRYYLAEEAK